jgi:hypothetical protein
MPSRYGRQDVDAVSMTPTSVTAADKAEQQIDRTGSQQLQQ